MYPVGLADPLVQQTLVDKHFGLHDPEYPKERFHLVAQEPLLMVDPPTLQLHEPTLQLWLVYEPLSEPLLHERDCEVQLLPQATLEAA